MTTLAKFIAFTCTWWPQPAQKFFKYKFLLAREKLAHSSDTSTFLCSWMHVNERFMALNLNNFWSITWTSIWQTVNLMLFRSTTVTAYTRWISSLCLFRAALNMYGMKTISNRVSFGVNWISDWFYLSINPDGKNTPPFL